MGKELYQILKELNEFNSISTGSKISTGMKISPEERRPGKPPFLLSYYENYGNDLGDHPSTFSLPISKGITLDFIDRLEKNGFVTFWEYLQFDLRCKPKIFADNILLKNDDLSIIVKIDIKWASENSDKATDIKMLKNCKSAKKKVYRKTKNGNKNYMYISQVDFLIPSKENRDQDKLNDLIKSFERDLLASDVREEKSTAKISMMTKDDFGMEFTDFDVSKSTPNLKNLDLFYGDGFQDYHNKLLTRLGEEKKGVVLLHGDPGTGKTYYIRALLKKLSEVNKRVIYIPPSMVDGMANPTMIGFLTNDIINEERDTILLIEDAEPLLQSRTTANGNVRTTGITNLLNSTDGILNDILGLVVICTFNTDLKNIDEALLRPGRLLARKEFNKIKSDKVKEVAKVLKIPKDLIKEDKDYTIAELTNLKAESKTLIHDYDKGDNEYRKIGFGNR